MDAGDETMVLVAGVYRLVDAGDDVRTGVVAPGGDGAAALAAVVDAASSMARLRLRRGDLEDLDHAGESGSTLRSKSSCCCCP